MANFGYPYNDLVICKDSTDYLAPMHMATHAYGMNTCIWQHMHMALTHAYGINTCIWHEHMHMATHAYCNTCIWQHMHMATHAYGNTCIWQYMHMA